jgi:hypothetical protein
MTSLAGLAVLAAFAIGMTMTSSVAVKWAAFASTPLRASVVQFLLLMMAGMFVGVLVFYAVGGASGIVEGLWVASAVMSASVLLVFVGFFRELRARGRPSRGASTPAAREGFVASVVALVILNELLMGWSFSLLSGQLAPGLGSRAGGVVSVLSFAVTSPWFVFPMALEMVVTLRWLRTALPRVMGPFLSIQPAIMVCSPPTFAGLPWVLATAVGASGLMALAVAFLLVDVIREEAMAPAAAVYVLALIASLGLMAGGLYLWIEFGIPGVFALALIVQMVVFLYAVTDPARFASEARGGRGSSARGPLTEAPERA